MALAMAVQGCEIIEVPALKSDQIIKMNMSSVKMPYILGVGDSIALKFFYNNGLSDEVTIRPDGKISLQLVGDVQAAGLTPAQLEAELREKYFAAFKSSNTNYALSLGDTIAVKFFYNDKLNDEVTIRPDGKISLQLVGDVQAAGLTPAQLEAALLKRYSEFLESVQIAVIVRDVKKPELTVAVKKFTSHRAYVGGEVPRPQAITLNGPVRALDAIIQAGGALDSAKLGSVLLIRRNGEQQADVYSLDLREVLRGKAPDVILEPYDVVYLPKTEIAQLNLFMQQYIYGLLPQINFTTTYSLNPEIRVKQEN